MFAATVITAAIVGYRYEGIEGMCSGALAGWVLGSLISILIAIVFQPLMNRSIESSAKKIVEVVEETKNEIAQLRQTLPASRSYYDVVLDSLPLDNYEATSSGGMKTEEEWGAIWPKRWLLLRRKLVEGYGLTEHLVDNAKETLLAKSVCVGPMPQSDKELAELVTTFQRQPTQKELAADIVEMRVRMGLVSG